MDKDFYNSSSSNKLGWQPSWFGCEYFDEELVKAIKKWQRDHGLKADGLCGPGTYRRIWTDRQSHISDFEPSRPVNSYLPGNKHIVHNGEFIPIEWDKVILWDDPSGLSIKPGRYYDNSGKEDRKPTMFVNHWDVCLSAESCARILNNKGISVHFCLDNDGTIYQLLDTQHGAWHCSKYHGNKKSIGIEISNAYYLKYQSWYVNHGFGERPIQDNGWVHGKKKDPFLWFYPVQLQALKALWKAVSIGLDIPLDYPKDSDGTPCTTIHSGCEKGTFKGFCNHYNFIKTKIDCAGLNMPDLLEEVKQTPQYCLDR